jgi:hypothetical protein
VTAIQIVTAFAFQNKTLLQQGASLGAAKE